VAELAKRKRAIPQYGTVTLNGIDYYRTRVQNADGKLVALYARTPEELYDKELGALEQIDNDTFCRKSPTVADYMRPPVKNYMKSSWRPGDRWRKSSFAGSIQRLPSIVRNGC
jgi:hypothetical protein